MNAKISLQGLFLLFLYFIRGKFSWSLWKKRIAAKHRKIDLVVWILTYVN